MIGELQLRGEQLAKHYWVAGEQVMIMIMMVAMMMTTMMIMMTLVMLLAIDPKKKIFLKTPKKNNIDSSL